MGWNEFEGSMLPHPVNYCITTHIIELEVWIIIICLIVYRVTYHQDKILDVANFKDVQCPVIKMDFVVIGNGFNCNCY